LPLSGVIINTLSITATGEPYESVLVTLSNLRCRRCRATTGDLTVAPTIVMDDDVFDYAAATCPIGTCFSTVTGVMGVNVFDDERRIFPRSTADQWRAPAALIGAGPRRWV
jgi:hypothetical protein